MIIKKWKLFLEELVGETEISDTKLYIKSMEMSIQDKLFFIENVDFDVIVDFGCANGTFLSKVKLIKPDVKIIAYDTDHLMLQASREILNNSEALITNNWSEIANELKKYKSPLLNLSSVIHEVYSYSNSDEIKKFWNEQVFNNNFKWIVIRDMIPSSNLETNNNFKADAIKVRKRANKFFLNSFEKRWGSIDDNYKTLCHFLLKYRYVVNWDREVTENYLPVNLEYLKSKIPSGYSITFEDSFNVPFIQNTIIKDFGVRLQYPTHL